MEKHFLNYTIIFENEQKENQEIDIIEQKAVVSLYDAENKELGRQIRKYIPVEEIYNAIDRQDPIILDNTYIKNFSLSEYRKSRDLEKETLIELHKFSASGAFFDAEKTIIDFSFADFGDQDVKFSNSIFAGSPTSFHGAIFGEGNKEFDYCYFFDGNINFTEAHLGKGDFSLKNTVFKKGEKNFEAMVFGTGQKLFMNAEFGDGDVNFTNAVFGDGRVSFKVARFGDGKIDFSHAFFGKGEFIFESTSFGKGNISFRTTSFEEGKKDFTRAEFGEGQVSFVNTEFGKGNINFVSTTFSKGKISFKLARIIEGDIDFHYSNFGGGDLNFDRTIFGDGLVDFRAVDFKDSSISFYRTEFGKGDVIFEACELHKGEMSFKNTRFGSGNLNFNATGFEDSDLVFEDCNFLNEAVTFTKGKFNTLKIKSSALNNFFDLRIRKCNFLDLSECVIRDIIDMRSHEFDFELNAVNFTGIRLLGRIYIDWKKSNIKELIYKQGDNHQNMAEQFRVLKSNFSTLGQYSHEDEAYVEFKRTELEAFLKDTLKRNKKNAFWAYPSYWFQKIVFDKVGLYATNPIRVILSMLIAYVCYSTIYIIVPLVSNLQIVSSLGDPEQLSIISRAFYFSAITFFTIGYGDFYPGGFLKIFAGLEGFTGVFMMSYFTVAFVRKILR